MDALHLNQLPDIPQRRTICELTSALWLQPDVVAIWLGGSLAGGTGDAFSDIDLRIAIVPARLPEWAAPSFEAFFVETPVVGQQLLRFGEDAFLHHLLLSSGELVDLFVQSAESEVTREPHRTLGCREEVFAGKLTESQRQLPVFGYHSPVEEQLRTLLVDFWINSHKHRTLLYRGLGPLSIQRIQRERDLLLRLWYIAATGQDYGSMRESVHSLTEIVSVALGSGNVPQRRLRILGAPLRNQPEMSRVIELNRKLVSELGHQLAHRYGFDYPSALEATVRRHWQAYVGSAGTSAEQDTLPDR
jgi:predicted nucleotidyltransferase